MTDLERLEELISNNTYYSWNWVIDSITSPKWDKTGRVHDWRNYIPEELQRHWADYSIESQIVALVVADIQAMGEDWD